MQLREKIENLACTIVKKSYNFIMTLLIDDDKDISIMTCQYFLEKNISSLLLYQLRKIFDDFYCSRVIGRERLVCTAV